MQASLRVVTIRLASCLVGLLVMIALYLFLRQQHPQNPQQQLRRELRVKSSDDTLTSTSLESMKEVKSEESNQDQQQPQEHHDNNNQSIGGNHLDDPDKIARALYIQKRKDASTSLYHYYKKVDFPWITQNLMILYWDTNGQLDPLSLDDTKDWWHGSYSYDRITHQDHREYGTMALLLDFDMLEGIPYKNVKPPVPILFYTIYNGLHNSSNYKVIPSPDDKLGKDRYVTMLAQEGAAALPFHEKNNTIVWRGTYKREPIRAKVLNISAPYLDAADVSSDPDKRLSEYDMSKTYKYQLDVGGVSGTAWTGFRWKLCSGNLVFKVETFSRDWWYDYIEPWQHYIPVRDDLTDLEEQYQWAENHPEDAHRIAQAGAKVCMDTFEQSLIEQYEANVLQSLPPASKDLYDELLLIREGYLVLSSAHPCWV